MKSKLSTFERFLERQKALAEKLDFKISRLEAELATAREMRKKLGGQEASRLAHNQEIAGPIPAPATPVKPPGPQMGFRVRGGSCDPAIDAMVRSGKL
jgi:hypothetical protein